MKRSQASGRRLARDGSSGVSHRSTGARPRPPGGGRVTGIDLAAKYRALFDHMVSGFALCRVIFDGERPVDYVYEQANPAFESHTGLKPQDVLGRRVTEVLPGIVDDPTDWIAIFGDVAKTGTPARFEQYAVPLERWYDVSAYRPEPGYFALLFTDVTPRKRSELELSQALEELRTAHAEATRLASVAEAALVQARGSERVYRAIGESINYGVWVCTPDGRNVYASESFLKLVGMTQEQCSDFGWGDVLHPDDAERTIAAWKQCVATCGTWDIEHRYRGVDGGWHHILARGVPVKDERGEVVCWAGINLDITHLKQAEAALSQARNQAEAERNRLEAVMEALPVGVAILDAQGGHLSANHAFAEIWGKSGAGTRSVEDYAAFKAWWADNGQPVAPAEWASARAVREGETVVGQLIEIERADGARRFVHNSAAPIADAAGTTTGCAVAIMDITTRRQAEEALREADRRKNEFLAMLSHELRNPLAPIRSALYVLEHGMPGGAEARSAQAVIGRQVAHLAHIVDDLLDVTRISRNKIELRRERLDLHEVIAGAVEDYRILLADKGVRFEVDLASAPLWVNVDRTRIAQVVGNLLQNALKFTPSGGRVRLSAGIAAGAAEVRVADTGMGIATEILPHLFQPFMQVDTSVDRRAGGLGLGLALVKGLTQLHGGEVSVGSEGVGKGAEFVVRLPLEAGDAGALHVRPSTKGRTPHRVLVIEDNEDAAAMLQAALQFGGHTVAVAHSGPEGLERARAFRPEVVLCDIGLPGVDGYAVARALRADPALSQARLIALTGYALPRDLELASEAGFDHHLSKPPDFDALDELVGRP
ncbi:MAG: PAS domain-containing protein [Bacteroidales bacterium]